MRWSMCWSTFLWGVVLRRPVIPTGPLLCHPSQQAVGRQGFGARNLSARVEGEDRPAAGDALEVVRTALLEAQVGADDGAERGPRGEHLPRAGEPGHAGGDVDRH